MEDSLTHQSRKLIEKLSLRREKNQTSFGENTNALLHNANNIRHIQSREIKPDHNISDSFPKSSVTSILGRSAFLRKSMPKRQPFGMTSFDQTCEDFDKRVLKNSDLLGYDWIAGMLENKSKESQIDKPTDYFDELDKFRRMNKQYCMSSENRYMSNQSNVMSDTEDYKKILDRFNYGVQFSSLENPNKIDDTQPHVYAYTLNERLFPVPLDFETAERGIPDPNNPHIIKVSIPSNRFLNRNQKFHSSTDRKSVMNQNSVSTNIGESLSLSSHCQPSVKISMPVSQIDKLNKKLSSSRQEPAGLIGNVLQQNCNSSINESTIPFIKNQPKSEQEAIEQLKRGKSGAKLSRLVPSNLEHRDFTMEYHQNPTNICQTRIVLKDMLDDSKPREINPFNSEVNQKKSILDQFNKLSDDIPRSSVSRKEMSKVYVDAIESIRDELKSN